MALEVRPRSLKIYIETTGREPYSAWIKSIRDPRTQARILRRVDRMQQGNFGDCKPVGQGVFELRMFFGPGYRVYFAEDGDTVLLLLCEGDKSTQEEDIEKARSYWKDYKKRTP